MARRSQAKGGLKGEGSQVGFKGWKQGNVTGGRRWGRRGQEKRGQEGSGSSSQLASWTMRRGLGLSGGEVGDSLTYLCLKASVQGKDEKKVKMAGQGDQ